MHAASDNRRQVAITGLGICSCLGNDLAAVSESLRNQRGGIVLSDERIARGFRSGLCTRVSPPTEGYSRKKLRPMSEPARYADFAARSAIADAGLDATALANPRCGVIFGSDSCIRDGYESVHKTLEGASPEVLGSGYVFRTMNSSPTINLAHHLGVGGANWTISAACASGLHAIGQAMMLIRSGLQDIVVAGGAQETAWEAMASFDALGVFSMRTDEPAAAVRPFDRDRDGLVPGGGGACVILESLDHARKRGAKIYGAVAGYGFSSGCEQLSHSSVESVGRAMAMALNVAGVDAASIDYINAHATGTPTGDAIEAAGIARVFPDGPPVSSTKAFTGHECWMAGASEVVYTTLMARDGFMAANLNFTGFDDQTEPIHIIPTTREGRIGLALTNSFGFGGTNAAAVLDFRSMAL